MREQVNVGNLCQSRLYELNIQGDGDFLAYKNAAGLKRGIPFQPEILALDLCRRLQTDARVPPRVFRLSRRSLDCQRNGSRPAMNAEVTLYRQFLFRFAGDLRRFERQRGVGLRIK